ncbi:MAG: ribonuclease III [Flavobacteriales bacterium]
MIARLFSRARNPEEKRVRAWCRQTLGITPGDLPLYRQALRHVSAVSEDRPDLPDNERLEFLGDAVLDAIIGNLLFQRYPDQGEGFLTRMRSKLVSRSQLNQLAKRIGIERVIETTVARAHESSVPGNALEALIGALFLDKGFERTRKVVVGLITQHFDLKEIEKEDRDGKSRLLEWGQKRRKKVEFVVREGGGGRGRHYVAEVRIGGELKGTGKGASKKTAEQDAAQSAFRSMRSRRHKPNDHEPIEPPLKREGQRARRAEQP